MFLIELQEVISLISSETTRSNVDAGSNLLISEELTINLLGSDGEPESFKHRGPKVVMDINHGLVSLLCGQVT